MVLVSEFTEQKTLEENESVSYPLPAFLVCHAVEDGMVDRQMQN